MDLRLGVSSRVSVAVRSGNIIRSRVSVNTLVEAGD